MRDDITHDELVQVGERWLRNNKSCGVVLPEVYVKTLPEEPDVIGWCRRGKRSILIECKASRGDFLSDMNKSHRHTGDNMGNHRYYLVPKNLISKDEVPKGWGLLYYNGWGISVIKKPTGRSLSEKGMKYESIMLYSELRRFHMLLQNDNLNNSKNGRRVKALFEAYGMSTSEITSDDSDELTGQLKLDFS